MPNYITQDNQIHTQGRYTCRQIEGLHLHKNCVQCAARKEDPTRDRITVGGILINYPGDCGTWNANRRYVDGQMVARQRCLYTRGQVLHDGHFQSLSQYTTEEKIICKNETFRFPQISGGTLQTQRNCKRRLGLCGSGSAQRNVWAPADGKAGAKVAGRKETLQDTIKANILPAFGRMS